MAIPRHVAIIMDGNGRWARTRGWQRLAGHREGVHSVRAITRRCRQLGVQALSLYSFSAENWGRPEDEVSGLMALLEQYLRSERDELLHNDIRLTHCGEVERLPEPVRRALMRLEAETGRCTSMALNLALSYGSQQELTRAVRGIARDAVAGILKPDAIDERTIEGRLDTAGLPPLDLLIRTSGELRLSNFMLWQAAYAELYVTDTPWPEFREADLDAAFASYTHRERRFGLTSAQVTG